MLEVTSFGYDREDIRDWLQPNASDLGDSG